GRGGALDAGDAPLPRPAAQPAPQRLPLGVAAPLPGAGGAGKPSPGVPPASSGMSPRSRRFRPWLRSLIGRDGFQRPQCRLPMLTLGRGHGRWMVWPDPIRPDTVVYSFGVGRDVSFERDLIARFGVTIHAFDPTPLSLEWARREPLPPGFVLHE